MAPAPNYTPQEQEELILKSAVDCINDTSLLAFTMSAISKKSELSMGSIYKHVQCKEDIIIALATKVFSHRCKVFQQVLAMPLSTPEKIIAIALLNPLKIKKFSFDNHLESFSVNELVIRKASPVWTERMIRSHENCENIFNLCMQTAITSGELAQQENINCIAGEINLGSWALIVGYQYVDRVMQVRNIAEGTDTLTEPVSTHSPIIQNMLRLLSTYTWHQPLDQAGIEKTANLLIQNNLR